MLLIQMQSHTIDFKRAIKSGLAISPDISQQVGNCRGAKNVGTAQRQVADSAHMLLKLADHAGALTRVIAVVRARRKLVDQELAVSA